MYFVKEINLNPHWEKKSPLKSIEFNFLIYENSEETVFMCEEKSNLERWFIWENDEAFIKQQTDNISKINNINKKSSFLK